MSDRDALNTTGVKAVNVGCGQPAEDDLNECQKCGDRYPWYLWRDHIHDALDEEREKVTDRLNGCDHDHVRRVTPTFPGGDSFWSCHACGQRFCPLLTEPVLVGDWGKPRLSDASNPEWSNR